MRDADAMKLERDGWLWQGPKRDMRTIKPVVEFIRRLPNGNVLTTDGRGGAFEWSPSRPPVTERQDDE